MRDRDIGAMDGAMKGGMKGGRIDGWRDRGIEWWMDEERD